MGILCHWHRPSPFEAAIKILTDIYIIPSYYTLPGPAGEQWEGAQHEKSRENAQGVCGCRAVIFAALQDWKGELSFFKTCSTFKVFPAERGEGDPGESQEVEYR